MFSEWLYLPEAAAAFLCDPGVWLFLIGGVFLGFVVGRRARTWADDGHGTLPWAGIPLGVHPRYGTARGHFCGLVRFWRHYRQPDQHPRHTRSSGDLSGWQRPDKAGQRPGGRRLFHCSVCCGNTCGHDPYLPDPALRDWHRPEVWRLGDLSVLRFQVCSSAALFLAAAGGGGGLPPWRGACCL